VTWKTFGDQAFSHAGPKTWNALALEIVGTLTLLKYSERLIFLRKLLICNFILLLLLLFLFYLLYMLWFKFSFGAKFLKLVQFLFSFVMYSLP